MVIDAVIDNRVRLRGPLPKNVALDVQEEFTHSNPVFKEMQRRGFGTGDEPPFLRTWQESPGELSVPRGGLERVKAILERAGVPHRWRDERVAGKTLHVEYELSQPLWAFQQEALGVALSRETSLVQSGTGGGKTTIGIAFAAAVGVPTLVVVHNGGLQRQWVKRACKLLNLSPRDIGVIGGGKCQLRPITVALHQTLARPGAVTEEMKRYFGAVVADEVHRFAARTAFAAIDPFPARRRLGLTADHKRKDKKDPIVRDLFGPVAFEKKTDELVAEGHTLDVEVRVVPTDFRAEWYLRGMERVYTGKSAWRGAAEQLTNKLGDAQMIDAGRNALALACVVRELAEGQQVIVLARRRNHCEVLDRMIVASGAVTQAAGTGYLVGGKADQREFERTADGLADGTKRVGVGTVEALGTGIDLPAVGVGVVATPIAGNKGLLNQVCGRICRAPEGKTTARLYYLWDRHVNPGHLENLVKWRRTVRLLTDSGWVDGRAALDDASLSFSPGGITELLSRPNEEPRRPRMRLKKTVSAETAAASSVQQVPNDPVPSQTIAPQASAAERTSDLFDKPASSFALASDDSALFIACKAKGFQGAASDVRDWNPAQKLSAAAWCLGKLPGDTPDHLLAKGFNGALAAPPSSRKGLEDDLGALTERLVARKVPVTLVEVSAWAPSARTMAARFCEGGDCPLFISKLLDQAMVAAGLKAPESDAAPRGRKPKQQNTPTDYICAVVDGPELADESTTVTVTWGEEKITLVPATFCTCTIGPFTLSGPVRPGESFEAAHGRLYAEVERLAERERGRKLASYRAALEEAGAFHAVPKSAAARS